MWLDCACLGKLVVAETDDGGKVVIGEIVAYFSAPSVTIKKSNGEKISWRADLCRPLTKAEIAIYYATVT